jgi:hypothetical protein
MRGIIAVLLAECARCQQIEKQKNLCHFTFLLILKLSLPLLCLN